MAELTVQMDVIGPENILQQENAYFDVTHTCVHRLKSLGLWLYHPTMRKIIRLASMDIRTENTKDIALFFTMFNVILQKVTGKPDYKFNPRYFMCDEGRTNHKAIKYVYGEDLPKPEQWDVSGISEAMPQRRPDLCQKMCRITSRKPVKSFVNQQQLQAGTTFWRGS